MLSEDNTGVDWRQVVRESIMGYPGWGRGEECVKRGQLIQ